MSRKLLLRRIGLGWPTTIMGGKTQTNTGLDLTNPGAAIE
jgi:hypothetical protein